MPFKIVFMGTPEFSVPTLEKLFKKNFNIVSVYTQPAKKSKRGLKINPSPVQKFCEVNKIKFRTPINLDSQDELNFFKELLPDLVVVVAYGKLIPKNFLGLAKLGFINIHASLLPFWRGAAPIQRAIISGDKKIGVSIMKIEEKLDSGPVLAVKELNLDEEKTFKETEDKLSFIGADLLFENLESIKNGNADFINQIHSKATYAKKIKKNETKINWNLKSNKIISHIYGLSPSPGAWFEYKGERYKVLRARKASLKGTPGKVLDNNLTIACQSGSIKILEIQRQGKNKQNIENFLLGNKIKKDSVIN